MVCLGNICRSPVAAVVLAAKVEDASLSAMVVTRSSGTGDWHIGGPMDPRAAASLTDAGYDPSQHRAAQFDRSWFDSHDVILAMDASNHRDITRLAPDQDSRDRVLMFRAFDPARDPDDPYGLDVPDPYSGGPDDYRLVLDIVERTTDQLVIELQKLT